MRARSHGLVAEDLRAALNGGQLCWTWLMRGTLHLVAMEDLPWLLPLFGPEFIRQTERRYAELGLDPAIRARATALLRQVLGDGPQTRAELRARLEAEGIPAEGAGLSASAAPCGAGRRAGLRAPAHKSPDYRRLSPLPTGDWPGVEAAVARLARRYLRAFGPAGAADPGALVRPARASCAPRIRITG